MPWRIGSGPEPTKLSQPGVSDGASIGRPIGFGRSSTRTALPLRAAVLEQVAQRRQEGVDAAAHVLQVHEQDVEGIHHCRSRPAHFPVEAEYRNAVHGVGVVVRLDHVVLLVAAQAVLRAEGGRELDVGDPRQRVERMHEARGDRGRMGEQGDAASRQRLLQHAIREQALDAEFHHAGSRSVNVAGSWKSGAAAPWASAHQERAPCRSSMTAASPAAIGDARECPRWRLAKAGHSLSANPVRAGPPFGAPSARATPCRCAER